MKNISSFLVLLNTRHQSLLCLGWELETSCWVCKWLNEGFGQMNPSNPVLLCYLSVRLQSQTSGQARNTETWPGSNVPLWFSTLNDSIIAFNKVFDIICWNVLTTISLIMLKQYLAQMVCNVKGEHEKEKAIFFQKEIQAPPALKLNREYQMTTGGRFQKKSN